MGFVPDGTRAADPGWENALFEGLAADQQALCADGQAGVTAEFCAMTPSVVRITSPEGESLVLYVLVADTARTRSAGFQHIHPDVMQRSAIYFISERDSRNPFHMCNVAAALDILWIRSDGRVMDAARMLPGAVRRASLCRDVYTPTRFGTYRYALEVPAGLLASIGFDVSRPAGWRVDVVERSLPPELALEEVVSGLVQPLQVTYVPGGDGRLLVVEKGGRIQVVEEGKLRTTPFIDLRSVVSTRSEQGLLSIAFHPDYASNRYIYLNFTNRQGATEVVRYTVDPDRLIADPQSAVRLLTIAQPAANHNGGMMAFGPDGYLYIGTGDGGGAGDPWRNGQNMSSLLGKLLRIDVDGAEPYAVPRDNPFVEEEGVRDEIWAYGLRNPWRFSFDRQTGDLFIADVGQNAWEEINWQPAGSPGGQNYGWNVMEGKSCYPPQSDCDPTGLTLPVHVYANSPEVGCSITGGYVYRGEAIPALHGWYLFGDYCSGRVWAMDTQHLGSGKTPEVVQLLQSSARIASFGEDEDGELYVADIRSGKVFRLRAR